MRGNDSSGGPMALLAAGAAIVIALALVVMGVLWVAPGAIAAVRAQGELGVVILAVVFLGGYTCAILALDAVGDGLAAMGAVAGLSLRKRKADAEQAEAQADATRAGSWAPGNGTGASVNGTTERDYTGPHGW